MKFSFTKYNPKIYLLKIESPGNYPTVTYVSLSETTRKQLISVLKKNNPRKKQ